MRNWDYNQQMRRLFLIEPIDSIGKRFWVEEMTFLSYYIGTHRVIAIQEQQNGNISTPRPDNFTN